MNKSLIAPQGLTHKFRKATSDRHHLLVVFSGFRNRGTYDLSGKSTTSIDCNILWIEDWFGTNHSYYISQDGNTEPAVKVNELIHYYLEILGLGKSQCTLVGFSKGGSGALYQAIKFDFQNVIAVAPRFNIATASRQRNIAVFENLLGNSPSDAAVETLDSAISNEISSDASLDKNIYLVTSKSDYQYPTEIEPNLDLFDKYSNFNYILTQSVFVQNHIDVSRYNVQMVLAIIMSLAEGAAPKYGSVKNGGSWNVPSPNSNALELKRTNNSISKFNDLKLQGGKIFPKGICFTLGNEAFTYGSIQRSLNLKSVSGQYRFPLGALNDPSLSKKYYDTEFIDYSKGIFASNGNKGISLTEINNGVYEIGIHLKHGKTNALQIPDVEESVLRSTMQFGDSFYDIRTNSSGYTLTKQPVLKTVRGECYFDLRDEWSEDKLLHLEGTFAVVGHPASQWDHIAYFLIYQKDGSDKISTVIPLAKDHKREINSQINDFPLDYSKCYFTTPKYKGVPAPKLPPGRYKRFVTAKVDMNVFTVEISDAVF